MKKVICPAPNCQDHRIHWSYPDTSRGPQMIEVSDDWPEGRPAYCSMTCALLAGYMTLNYPTNPCPKCKAQGMTVEHGKDYKCQEP